MQRASYGRAAQAARGSAGNSIQRRWDAAPVATQTHRLRHSAQAAAA